jgi:hypothetical protein
VRVTWAGRLLSCSFAKMDLIFSFMVRNRYKCKLGDAAQLSWFDFFAVRSRK